MKNWKKIADGQNLQIPEADLERVAPTLDDLETRFRPLTKQIPDYVEPAITFSIQPEPSE